MIHFILSVKRRSSEAFASEFLENLEDIYPRYYMHSDILSNIESSITHTGMLTLAEVLTLSIIVGFRENIVSGSIQ